MTVSTSNSVVLDATQLLIACITCKGSIAAMAEACPHCGAPNGWKHPSVEAFVAQKSAIQTKKPFIFWHNKTEVWGETKARPPLWAYIVSGVIFTAACVWVLLAGLGWGFLVCCAFAGVIPTLAEKKDSFRADLKAGAWTSTNERFWQPVRNSLKV